jgi:amino acid transporter
MSSPVILTVTSGFGIGGDTFALAMLIAFIMMQAQLTTFSEAAAMLPTSGSVYDYISCGMGVFSPLPAHCPLISSSIFSPAPPKPFSPGSWRW